MTAKMIFLVMLSIIFVMGCEMEALLGPGDEGGERDQDVRDRRPTNDGSDPEVTTTQLLIPLQEGGTWSYHVDYIQTSNVTADYSVAYRGTEQWSCSLARFSDSTFVFQTHFTGEKIITHQGDENTESIQGAYASVTAKIVHGTLTIVREEGDLMCPFLGDWLALFQDEFVCVHSTENSITREKNDIDLAFSYTLVADRGLIKGTVARNSQYDQILIEYNVE